MDAARALLTENGVTDGLLEDAFVFYMHQGYEFGYFRLGEGEDPPAYQFVEGGDGPQIEGPSFTAYLVDVIHSRTQGVQRH